jgi:hypothetical protein
VAQESNMMGDFCKELKGFVDKHVSKKIIKLYSPEGEWKQEAVINEEKAIGQEEIYQYSQFLNSLISRYSEVGIKIYDEGRDFYRSFVGEVKQSFTELFTFFNEIQNTYYNEEEYAKSYHLFQEEMSASIKKGMQFFQEIELSAILKETAKITFDSEFNKLEGFKKIKKPKEFEEL